MSMQEPGLDLHAWESEYESLEPDLEDDPTRALPELANLVERMLGERGYQLEEPVTAQGNDPEILAEYRAAREVADLADAAEQPDPGDVASAINGLRAIYEYLIAERAAP
jgi:hypothetical protein